MTFREDVIALLQPHVRARVDVDRLAASLEDLFIADFDCGVADLRVQVEELRDQIDQLHHGDRMEAAHG